MCRGAAQPNRPLHRPCKCRGSIRHVHQDCLEDWLKRRPPRAPHPVTGGHACELCLSPLIFEQVYAAGGRPDSLPVFDVLNFMLGGALRFVPIASRIVLVVLLWLIVLPLSSGLTFQIARLVVFGGTDIRSMLISIQNFLYNRYNAPSSLIPLQGFGGMFLRNFSSCIEFIILFIFCLQSFFCFCFWLAHYWSHGFARLRWMNWTRKMTLPMPLSLVSRLELLISADMLHIGKALDGMSTRFLRLKMVHLE